MQWIDPLTGRVNYDALEIQNTYIDSPDNSLAAPTPPPTANDGKIILYGRKEMPAGDYHLYARDGDGGIHDLFSGGATITSESIMRISVAGSTVISSDDVPAGAEITEIMVRVNSAYAAGQLMTITHDGNTLIPSTEVNLELEDVFVVKALHLTSNTDKISVNISGISPGGANCDVFVRFGTSFLS